MITTTRPFTRKILGHFGTTRSLRPYSKGFPWRDPVQQVANSKMPKDKQFILSMQRQRQKIKERNFKVIPGIVQLQILGSGARGSARCLYVSSDHTKYLFNCGEGTQRLAFEHRRKLTRVEHVFVTTPTWNNMGGLPGVALTVQDNGVSEFKLHGPEGSIDLFNAIKKFVILKDLTVHPATCSELNPFQDQTMTVHYVLLTKPTIENDPDDTVNDLTVDNTDYYSHELAPNGKRKSYNGESSRKLQKTEPQIIGGRVTGSMAYICKLRPRPGSLDLNKCVEKGVTPGPVLGQLKAGNDVTLPDGTLIKSADVCTPQCPGPVFIVIECPTVDYLDSLTNNETFKNYQATASEEDNIAYCVVHFTPEEVLKNPRYKEWINKFSQKTQHIIINEENECIGSEAVHRIQHKLHLLHPEIFPFFDSITFEKSEEANPPERISQDSVETEEINPIIHRVKTLHSINLRPLTGLDKSLELSISPKQYVDEAFAVDGFLDALAELQTNIAATSKSLINAPEYPKVLMLGTGSCIPNKVRNTSGILLRLDKECSILLDCGEGTMGQIIRFYGKSNATRILKTIKAVYVSHLHADHHIGLIGLLKERARVTEEPLFLIAPEQISAWLQLYHKRFESILDLYILVPNSYILLNEHGLSNAREKELYSALNVRDISTVRVKHCPFAYGVAVTDSAGNKIVYSGDTVPCDNLIKLGADCELLIHEATMEDDMEAEARMKLHSTISQAITSGNNMRAKFILLTHFSQRYSKMPRIPEDSQGKNFDNVGIAYDNMLVSLAQLPILPLLYPSLRLMFSEFCVLLEERATKRQLRLEKLNQEFL
ncbi:ribonuclease Z, mitochondrial [Cephus cinctus]|uniref:Zinc phosphodiesterase ELAC protein 2 n=1 Tax=Cephus cinctus TaxID=211228 RepID=A0AAJ7BM07_CEPCN|nr:ribonuclease Z, mitochondrial [Cephus cinctus]